MFDAAIEHIESGQVTKYRVTLNGDSIPSARVVDLWHNDAEFRQYFSELLAQSPFSAYRWETPAFSDRLAANPFEFVLLNCPSFATRRTDSKTYADYFTIDDANDGIVTFANLSGDATLIVPSPRASSDIYGHLASFIRGASKPVSQHASMVRGTILGT